MDLSPSGAGRMVVALGVLVVMAVSVWLTMEPGRYRTLAWVVLAFFAFRIVLGRMRARSEEANSR